MSFSSLAPTAQHPSLPKHVPFAVTTRGGNVENVHFGSLAVVDRSGALIAHVGDVETPVFTRSALKPLQALPLVAHPRFAELGLTTPQLALLCASHNGEEKHAEAAREMLARARLGEAALQCGSHAPYWYQANDKRPEEGRRWNSLYHNCSGKHSGMLLYATLLDADLENYLEFDHPVQRDIRAAVAYACGLKDGASMPWGTDGCSAPNYAVPLAGLARAFAWLTSPTDSRFADAPATLFNAMAKHPDMVSGDGRNDLALSRAGRGDWIAKVGADGVQTIASHTRGIGIAAKVSDGNQKALMVAVCAALEQLNMLDAASREELAVWAQVPIRSIRGVEVGRIEPHLHLH
ncbi:MAG: asparaginase [Betaproteobacteria bacterium]|nr:MAG: asparaginase [Betaproteobacteria bacterium]